MDKDTETSNASLRMQRDALTMLLLAQGHGLVQQLALLAASEKAALAGLILIGHAMDVYARSTRPDQEIMDAYGRLLEAFSPAVARQISLPIATACTLSDSVALAGIASMSQQFKELLAALVPPTGAKTKGGGIASLPLRR